MKPRLYKSNLFSALSLTVASLAFTSSPLQGTTTLGIETDEFTSSGSEFGNLIVPGWGKFNDGIDIGANSESLMNWLNGILIFDVVQAQGSFLWRDTITPPSSAKQKMRLDGSNVLSLYNSSGLATSITLNGSTGAISASGNLTANSLTINDIAAFRESLLLAPASSGNSIAMSLGFADGYNTTAMSGGQAGNELAVAMSIGLATGFASTAMSAGSATGDFSIAMNGEAIGACSTAMSAGTADGYCSTAMTLGHASGEYSTAMSLGGASSFSSTAMSSGYAYGEMSTAMSSGYAYGDMSTAMSASNAVGDYSTALSNGTASGMYSMAAGFIATATSYTSASFGRYNKTWGSATAWVETDPLLLVGNGTGESALLTSNAITTLKNGQTMLTNKAWKADNNVAPTTANSNAEALVVEGHARLAGNTRLLGNTTLEGKVIITVPQGDISMGIYGP